MNPELVFSNVTFEYPGATEAMFEALSLRFSQGWTGIVGANGGGKTTLLHLAAGLLKPEIGTVRCVGHCDLCGQTDDEPPAAAEAFFSSYDTEAYRVREAFGVDEEMLERWDTLSFGERRRLTLAATVFEGPDILCLDEPTNHLDPEARDRLIKGLRLFTGIGLVVSHDRVLLDALCTQCLFVGNGTAILRPGRYDVGRAQAEREQTLALDTLTRSQDLLRKAKGELQRRRVALQNVEAQDTKRAVSKNDHDARNYINSKRNTDSTGGFAAAAGAQARRVSRLAKDIATMDRPESRKLGLAFPLTFRAKSNTLLTVPAQQLSLGGERQLTLPEIILCPEDRIALTGPNGAGKSSLLRLLLPKITLPAEQVLYLPQALDAKARAEMRETLDRLPREAFAHVMNVVATLGSEPGRVSAAADWSPGEARKLFLGLATLRPVALMILDEPTNHLDLPAVENLEEALNEAECALLVISHDAPFLKRVCPKRWELSLEGTFRAVDYSFNNE